MLNRRGFSPDELEQIDPELFEYLMIFDEFIEPNGSRYDMSLYANLCHLILVSSGNLSERGQKDASVLDWDFHGLLRNYTTGELLEHNSSKKTKEAKEQMDGLAEMIKSIATKDKNNGKE